MGLSVALTLLFIALKLCGVIAWSWGWVLSPIPFEILFWGFVLVIVLIVGSALDKRNARILKSAANKMTQRGAISLIAIALISIISGLITLQANKAINDADKKTITVYVPKKEEGKK